MVAHSVQSYTTVSSVTVLNLHVCSSYTGLFSVEQHNAERNFLFFLLIFFQLLLFLSFVTL